MSIVLSKYFVVIQLVVDGHSNLDSFFETAGLDFEGDVVLQVHGDRQAFLGLGSAHEDPRGFVWNWTHGSLQPLLRLKFVFILFNRLLFEPES